MWTSTLGLNDMEKISYLDIHARYLDIDTIRYDTIRYDCGFCENPFQKNREIILSHIQMVDREIFAKQS